MSALHPETWILGVETSCDETAAAVVADGRVVRSNVVASQVALHAPFGGVFPEVASRQHVRDITWVIEEAMSGAGATWDRLDALAVTVGPGLSGSLLVGVNAAKGMALASGRPLVGVSHLEGHLYANWLHVDGQLRTPDNLHEVPLSDPPFPYLGLIVSGGHTDLVLVSGHGQFRLLGGTLDDAAGEAFDKTARLLGLGYPGGPELEKAAQGGRADAYRLPVAATESPFDFSFSGLKTAVLRLTAQAERAGQPLVLADVAASFQEAVAQALAGRVQRALAATGARALLAAGGVSANATLRKRLRQAVDVPVRFPPLVLCTDNAAMIAAAAYWHLPASRDWLAMDVDASLSFTPSGDDPPGKEPVRP